MANKLERAVLSHMKDHRDNPDSSLIWFFNMQTSNYMKETVDFILLGYSRAATVQTYYLECKRVGTESAKSISKTYFSDDQIEFIGRMDSVGGDVFVLVEFYGPTSRNSHDHKSVWVLFHGADCIDSDTTTSIRTAKARSEPGKGIAYIDGEDRVNVHYDDTQGKWRTPFLWEAIHHGSDCGGIPDDF